MCMWTATCGGSDAVSGGGGKNKSTVERDETVESPPLRVEGVAGKMDDGDDETTMELIQVEGEDLKELREKSGCRPIIQPPTCIFVFPERRRTSISDMEKLKRLASRPPLPSCVFMFPKSNTAVSNSDHIPPKNKVAAKSDDGDDDKAAQTVKSGSGTVSLTPSIPVPERPNSDHILPKNKAEESSSKNDGGGGGDDKTPRLVYCDGGIILRTPRSVVLFPKCSNSYRVLPKNKGGESSIKNNDDGGDHNKVVHIVNCDGGTIVRTVSGVFLLPNDPNADHIPPKNKADEGSSETDDGGDDDEAAELVNCDSGTVLRTESSVILFPKRLPAISSPAKNEGSKSDDDDDNTIPATRFFMYPRGRRAVSVPDILPDPYPNKKDDDDDGDKAEKGKSELMTILKGKR